MTLFNSFLTPAHRTKQDGTVNSGEDLVEHRAQTLAAHHDNAVRALRRQKCAYFCAPEPRPHDTSVRIAHTIVMFLGFLIRVCTTAGMQWMMQHPLCSAALGGKVPYVATDNATPDNTNLPRVCLCRTLIPWRIDLSIDSPGCPAPGGRPGAPLVRLLRHPPPVYPVISGYRFSTPRLARTGRAALEPRGLRRS
jgi:hypothetical protein